MWKQSKHELIKSASLMMKRDVTARVILTAISRTQHLDAYRERNCQGEAAVMETKIHRLVAFQE